MWNSLPHFSVIMSVSFLQKLSICEGNPMCLNHKNLEEGTAGERIHYSCNILWQPYSVQTGWISNWKEKHFIHQFMKSSSQLKFLHSSQRYQLSLIPPNFGRQDIYFKWVAENIFPQCQQSCSFSKLCRYPTYINGGAKEVKMAATMGRLKLHLLFMYAAAQLKTCFYHPKGQGKGYSFKL